MKISLSKFGGMAPKYDETQLPEGFASLARNVRIDVGGVKPLRHFVTDESITPVTDAISLYHYDAFDLWLLSTIDKEYCSTVLPNDPHKRLFITDEEYPKVRSNTSEYRLGIPTPTILTAEVTVTGDLSDPLLVESPSYVATYVNAWGAEGPPSAPIPADDNIGPGFSCTLSLDSVPVGDYNLGAGAMVRIYRTASSGSTTEYLFVGEVDISLFTLVDTVDTSALQEPLPSADWVGPPDDDVVLWPEGPLRGVIDVGNGVLAGFSGKTLHFSEAYVPHGWPLDYRIPGPDTIIGLVSVARGILVLTTGRPWLATGTSPSSMVRVTIESNHSCTSAKSIVDMGAFAVWASPDGICASDGSEPTLLTKNILDKDSWATYAPTTIRAAHYKGMYIIACDGERDGAMFSMDGAGTMQMVEFDAPLKIMDFHYFLEPDELFCLMSDGSVTEFDAGLDMIGRWVSPIYRLPAAAFSALRVDANRYPIDFTLGLSNQLRYFMFEAEFLHDGGINNERVYRLPHGMRGRNWQITLHVEDHIHSFEMATSVTELT